jgi:putative FmdB family regulatory protein
VPIYEFYCADCRSKFEVLTSYEASREEMLCASCHSKNTRKLLSLVAKRSHGGDGDDFGDFGGDLGGEMGDEGGDDFDDGCSCGGACNCNN